MNVRGEMHVSCLGLIIMDHMTVEGNHSGILVLNIVQHKFQIRTSSLLMNKLIRRL
jgi:hypothetical protein